MILSRLADGEYERILRDVTENWPQKLTSEQELTLIRAVPERASEAA